MKEFNDIRGIKKILVDVIGWIEREDERESIIPFDVNEEMAENRFTWYRYTRNDGLIRDFNGKYVIEINYYLKE